MFRLLFLSTLVLLVSTCGGGSCNWQNDVPLRLFSGQMVYSDHACSSLENMDFPYYSIYSLLDACSMNGLHAEFAWSQVALEQDCGANDFYRRIILSERDFVSGNGHAYLAPNDVLINAYRNPPYLLVSANISVIIRNLPCAPVVSGTSIVWTTNCDDFSSTVSGNNYSFICHNSNVWVGKLISGFPQSRPRYVYVNTDFVDL